MTPIRLNEISPEKLKEIVRRKPLIMIPLGTTEWHAAHLPLGVDTLLSMAVCEELSSRTGVIVAPALSCGISRNLESRRGYFGTVTTINIETLANLLAELARGYAALGFRHIVVYSGHGEGEHIRAVEEACAITREIHSVCLSVEDFLAGKIVEREDDEATWPLAPDHAGEWETSMMLHFFPELVNMDKAPETIELDLPGIPAYIRRRYPRRASKEYGEKIANEVIEGGERVISALLEV